MKIEEWKIDKILPYAQNPRYNDHAVNQVLESIKEFGFQQPLVVDKQGVLIVGHTRYKAAIELGLETVPVVVASNLTEKQVKSYRLTDNSTAENAKWNDELLFLELKELDFTAAGFNDQHMERIKNLAKNIDTAEDIKAIEKELLENSSIDITDEEFQEQMQTINTPPLPIIPEFLEKYSAFIIIATNEIDETWMRERLHLNENQQSYKSENKIKKANIMTIEKFRQCL